MQFDKHIKDLSNYRLNRANENLEAAKILLGSGYYSESINRSYYAIFHCVRALLAFDEFDSTKHSGIISYFNKCYVKTNKVTKKLSVILNQAFMIRNKSDYDDFYIASKQEAQEQNAKAELFMNEIKRYIVAEKTKG
ncbi:MAG: HEPN domain-containing protein [Clostridiaceae bacterium]|nr:HEPN domain-containing protein [Clostridiaceae bacterium]